MLWRSKTYAEAIQLIATLRAELEAQAERYSKLLEQSAARERELMDRLMKLTPAPFPLPAPRQSAPVALKDAPRQQFNFPGRKTLSHPPQRALEPKEAS